MIMKLDTPKAENSIFHPVRPW